MLLASGDEHATMHKSALYYTILCCAQSLSHVLLFATPKEYATCQAPLIMGFSRQEYQSGLPFPSPGDLPNSEIEPRSPVLQADFLLSELPGERIH